MILQLFSIMTIILLLGFVLCLRINGTTLEPASSIVQEMWFLNRLLQSPKMTLGLNDFRTKQSMLRQKVFAAIPSWSKLNLPIWYFLTDLTDSVDKKGKESKDQTRRPISLFLGVLFPRLLDHFFWTKIIEQSVHITVKSFRAMYTVAKPIKATHSGFWNSFR